MKTSFQGEAQVVFMEEEQETFKDSSGIEFDFFGCLEVMELRLVKRFESIEERLEEQNKKLNTILEVLSNKNVDESKVTKPKSPAPKPHNDHKYVEIPFELHNTSLIGSELTDFTETKYPSPLHSHIDYYSQTLPVSPMSQPQKKRKIETTQPSEIEVVECIEIIPQNEHATNYLNLNPTDDEYQEVEVEVEHIEELPKSFTHSPFLNNRGAKPFVKVNSIPPLPIDNIDVLRGFNKSLVTNKVMAAEFTRNLSLFCADDKDSAPEQFITSIIGPSLLLQSTWASKSSGRLRIASLMGILNCVMKAAEQAPFGGFLMNFFREKVMDLLHSLKTQDRAVASVTPLAIKNENIE